jgi:hypothetical protein
MEIESPTFEELEKMVKIFGLQKNNNINTNNYIELATLLLSI